MPAVSTVLRTVGKELKMSTMLSWQQDTETRVERSSGMSKTLGEPYGEVVDSSRSKEETTCALLPNATLILLSIGQTESKHDLNIRHHYST